MRKTKSPADERLVVVLGSHRNGTSAITRALMALGVDLGENLLPPVAGDNDKGYWEDGDVNDMHHELLDYLGAVWSDLQWPTDAELRSESLSPFKMRALEILRGKVAGKTIFGLKNPRISRLLPFWEDVFKRLGRDVSYVIAVRNPLSAQRSIAKDNLRGEIHPEKAHYLWMSHVVPSVELSVGHRRVVVEYDRLLDNPRHQLKRIAGALDLRVTSQDAVEEYANSFLQPQLRHNRFESRDFALAPELPVEVAKAYLWLSDAADDRVSLDDDILNRDFSVYSQRLTEMRPAFQLVGRTEKKSADLARAINTQAALAEDIRGEMVSMRTELAERSRQLDGLIASLSQRDAEVVRRASGFAERESQLAGLREMERASFESELSNAIRALENSQQSESALNQEIAARKREIMDMQQSMADIAAKLTGREEEVEDAKRRNTELDDHVASLQAAVLEREKTLEEARRRTLELEDHVASLDAAVVERENILEEVRRSAWESGNRATSLETALSEQVRSHAETRGQVASLEEALAGREGVIVDAQNRIVEMEARLAALDADLAEIRKSHASAIVDNLRAAAELESLRAEAATFGAKIGRGLTRLRAKWMPMDTFAGRWVTRLNRFATINAREGLDAAIKAGLRKVISGKTVSALHGELKYAELNHSGLVSSMVQATRADHPELAAWIDANEPDRDALAAQMIAVSGFSYKPTISVIIPIYRVPREVLEETLLCLMAQTYDRWQACLAWADTEDLEGWRWLERRVADDARFKAIRLDENGGISRNSNRALEIADGEFIALLDHDDTLTPWAFFDVISLLQAEPDLDFIYSDKDSISADGDLRLNALFKPGWSPEMLHSVNYLTHLNVMRAELVREIGGWSPETDGAQDWDIFFRITERTSRIARIPSIHYHWRILPTSTATGLQAKPYAALGQLKAQQAYFRRKGLPAEIESTPEGLFHVGWPSAPSAAEVIVVRTGTIGQTVTVLDMLRAGTQGSIGRIHVASPPSASDELARLAPFNDVWGEKIRFVETTTGWSNTLQGIEADEDSIVVLLDGRASGLSSNLVDELVGWVQFHPEIAWASAIALHPDGTVQEAGRVLGRHGESAPLFRGSPLFSFGWFGGPLWYRNARAASAYAFAVRLSDARRALERMGSPSGGLIDFAAFCLSLTAEGRRGIVNPFAKIYFDTALESEWPNSGHLYRDDPYFNPAFKEVSPLRLHT